MLAPTFRWRCASSLVIAAYGKVRLIPRGLRALPMELACPSGYFAKPTPNRKLFYLYYIFVNINIGGISTAVTPKLWFISFSKL